LSLLRRVSLLLRLVPLLLLRRLSRWSLLRRLSLLLLRLLPWRLSLLLPRLPRLLSSLRRLCLLLLLLLRLHAGGEAGRVDGCRTGRRTRRTAACTHPPEDGGAGDEARGGTRFVFGENGTGRSGRSFIVAGPLETQWGADPRGCLSHNGSDETLGI